jgi:hypothetical protein
MAVLLAAAVGCGGSGTDGGARVDPTPAASPESCPDVTGADGSFAAIDFVDFVQAFGRHYVAGLYASRDTGRVRATATRADLDRVVLRSKCSFSALNDRTHKSPGEPQDGDTGFLPPGTPIYSLHGWSTDCRLAAEHDGRLNVYLAYRTGTEQATPRACALGHRR